MGKRKHHDVAGPLSPLTQAIVIHRVNEVREIALRIFARDTSHGTELILSFTYQVLPQSAPLNPQSVLTTSTPPSHSPSPLSLSPREYGEASISDPSLLYAPADGDIVQESDSSDSHSECLEPDSESSEAPSTMTVSTVRNDLASKRFFYDNEEALERGGQAIKKKALEIMTSQRHSPTSRDNAPLLKEAIKRYSSSTERTLVHNVWCILKRQYRDVIGEASPNNDGKAMEWVKRAWVMDYLDCVLEADLTKDSIPDTSYTASSELKDGCDKY